MGHRPERTGEDWTNAHSSMIHNSHKVEAAQSPPASEQINRRRSIDTVRDIHPYEGLKL